MLGQPIALAIVVSGIVATLGLVSWSVWEGGSRANRVPVFGYAFFLAWFGTGLALAVRLPVFRLFRASRLLALISLAGFFLGWLISPEGMFRAWSVVSSSWFSGSAL
ncbi:hypothetical protein [Tautonia rosea]|uniref:hypothetical protein n=1 Tax=Tautonia rosea TaxID=2728037 RepID=UPI00147505F2|nr:hypothetical protein [Tautonia rosea]